MEEGIVPGGGVALLRCVRKLEGLDVFEEEGNLADDRGTGGEVSVPLREPKDQYWNEDGDDEDVGAPDEEYDNNDYENEELDDAYSEEI